MFVAQQGYGAVHAVDVNNRVRNLAPGRRGGPEVESLSRAAEPLRPRGPPAAARGLPAPAAHERRGGQQALELRLCQRHAGNRIQRPVGGSPLPGRAGLLPRRRGAVVGQARAAELQLVGRGIPGVQQLFRIRGRVPGGDRQGVLPAATARKTQTSFHHG